MLQAQRRPEAGTAIGGEGDGVAGGHLDVKRHRSEVAEVRRLPRGFLGERVVISSPSRRCFSSIDQKSWFCNWAVQAISRK